MSKNFASAWAEEFSGSTVWTLVQLAVTVALGFQAWRTWADGHSSTEVFWWMLALLIYVVVVVAFHAWRAWQKQRDRVIELEQSIDDTRPNFESEEVKIRRVEPGPDVDLKEAPYQFTLSLLFRSVPPRRPVYNLSGRMVVTDGALLTPPMIDTAIDNGYTETRAFHTKLPLHIPKNLPLQYMALSFDYMDKLTGRQYSQRFYYKWDGVKNGLFHNEFFTLSRADTDRFAVYLKKQLGDWEL